MNKLGLSLFADMARLLIGARQSLIKVFLPLYLLWATAIWWVTTLGDGQLERRPFLRQVVFADTPQNVFPWELYGLLVLLWWGAAPALAVVFQRLLVGAQPTYPSLGRVVGYGLRAHIVLGGAAIVLLTIFYLVGFASLKTPEGRLPWIQFPHFRSTQLVFYWLVLVGGAGAASCAVGGALTLVEGMRQGLRHGVPLALVAGAMYLVWRVIHTLGHDALTEQGVAAVMAVFAYAWPLPILLALLAQTAVLHRSWGPR